jgi:hypothetical protein
VLVFLKTVVETFKESTNEKEAFPGGQQHTRIDPMGAGFENACVTSAALEFQGRKENRKKENVISFILLH